jgi:hypothetical protein
MAQTKRKTAMAEALVKVGFETAQERLDRIARECAMAGSYETAKARLEANISNDAAILWRILQPRWYMVAADILSKAGTALRAEAAGPVGIGAPRTPARPSNNLGGQSHRGALLRRAAEAGTSQSRSATQEASARPGPLYVPADVAALKAGARHAARTIFDTWQTPLGKALGDCTGSDLTGLAAKSKRDGKFYEFCAHGLTGALKLRDCKRPDDVEALLRAANKENDNA